MFQDVSRPLDGAVMRMRAFGTCAYILLSFILCIGPLARLDTTISYLCYTIADILAYSHVQLLLLTLAM